MGYVHKPGCPSPTLCNCYPVPASLIRRVWGKRVEGGRTSYVCTYAAPNGTVAACKLLGWDEDRKGIATFLPKPTLLEALEDVKSCAAEGAEAWVEQYNWPPQEPYRNPTCFKCGRQKVYDIFKGEYCSWCNDWC